MAEFTQAQLDEAVRIVKAAIPADDTLVLVGDNVHVTAKQRYPNGTFQVTTKLKDGAR